MLRFVKKFVEISNWSEIAWLIESGWEVVNEDADWVELALEL